MKRYLPKSEYREFIIDNINNGDLDVVNEDHIYLTEQKPVRTGDSKAYTCVGNDENQYHFSVIVKPEYESLFHQNMKVWSTVYNAPYIRGYKPTKYGNLESNLIRSCL